MSAPAAAARRITSALRVSMEISASVRPRRPSMTGMTRRSSSSTGTASEPGRVRLAADVENVGAFLGESQPVRDGRLRRRVQPAIGEAVRRDVDDAHDARPVERQAGEARARALMASRSCRGMHRPAAPVALEEVAERDDAAADARRPRASTTSMAVKRSGRPASGRPLHASSAPHRLARGKGPGAGRRSSAAWWSAVSRYEATAGMSPRPHLVRLTVPGKGARIKTAAAAPWGRCRSVGRKRPPALGTAEPA